MRRLLKFLHTVGAIGLMGSMTSLLVILIFAHAPGSPAEQTAMIGAMAPIADWVFMPSLVLTLAPGLGAMAVTPAYQDAGWAWVKAATGILMFEGGLVRVQGPIHDLARRSVGSVAGSVNPAVVERIFVSERNTLWVLIAVSLANVALGVWRPRLPQYPV